jgi:hypothetical protein
MAKRNVLDSFVERMKLLGIEVQLGGNAPWIYLEYINGHRVKKEDYYLGNHGFTIAWYADDMQITDVSKTIALIRKYR